MKFTARAGWTAAAAIALWGGTASAATEQIVCQQKSGRAMADCVLISPASSSAAGASVSARDSVIYQVVEPTDRNARNVVVAPEQSVVVAEPAKELRQPSVPQPYPMESSARDGRPEVRYLVATRDVPASAAPGETVIVPAQRIFVTEPAPFPSVTAPPWPD